MLLIKHPTTLFRTVICARGWTMPCRSRYKYNEWHVPWQRKCSRYSVHTFSSFTSFASSTDGDKNDKPDEYELRVGHAIATLQDDLPRFFAQGLTEHTIYSPHIVLSDPNYTRLSVRGRTAYLGIAQMLRWSLRLYFDDILFEIVRMRVLPDQPGRDVTDEDALSAKNMTVSSSRPPVRHLEVRWRLKGMQRQILFFTRPLRHVEGVFVYTFDRTGCIGEHRIQRIVPPPSRRILWLHSLGGRLRAYWEAAKQRREPALTPGLG